MGSSHSVLLGSQKREDMSCCDIEHKHGKTWTTLVPRGDHLSLTSVFRFCLFMGVSCNNMQNDEEQSLVTVRLPKNCLFLLKQLKNWITNNFHYSIFLQIENHDAFYQGANRLGLPWDAHEPPPKRVKSGGSWYIASMEVLKDEIDLGGRYPENPEVHLKVILHVANRRMTWTPPVINTSVLNYHVDKTLSPKELCQLVSIQKYLLPNEQPKDPIPKDTRTLIPGLLEFNHGAIHLDCRNLNISSIPNTVLHSFYYKSDFNLNFPNPVSTIFPNPRWFNKEAIYEDHQDLNGNGNSKKCPPYTTIKAENTGTLVPRPPEFNHDVIHLDYQNLNIRSNPNTVLHSSYYKSDLNLNFPNPLPSTIIPNPRWFNNEAIHKDHQDLNANRNSKKCPLSTNIKAGNSAVPRLGAIFILLYLVPSAAADLVPQSHQVGIEILRDSNNLNCTLKIDNENSLCYGDCNQNQKHQEMFINNIVQKLLSNVCKQQKTAMEVNQISLMRKHSLSSDTLQLILIWELDKDLNLMDVIIQYIFDGKTLPEKEMTNLPMPIIDFRDSDPNSPVYMEKMKDYVKELWEGFREKLLPFLKIDDQPENTNSLVNANAKNKIVRIFIKATGIVLSFILVFAIILYIKGFGKKTCKKLHETCCKVIYRRADQNEAEAEGDPNVMEALKKENHVADSV
ncbi:uncharacterized protein [Aquarana catesbeiana]|uniref:uncharacterized protein isoform X2 n=1 Tax=Aquarana catesbeiana TaxID=8400 RepID=UPI003CC9E843